MDGVRVLPLLVVAGLALLALKSAGLLLSGSYVLSGSAPASAQNTPATQNAPKPAADAPDTKAASEKTPAAEEEMADNTSPEAADQPQQVAAKDPETDVAKPGEEAKPEKQPNPKRDKDAESKRDVKSVGSTDGSTPAERAVLEGLTNRRKALNQRERELDLQENLLKAAEKRVEARIVELKAIEQRIESELKKRDDHRKEQYQKLVKMYSGMKPKDAARIFDRLDMNVLTGLVSQMKPRIMSSILANMKPAAAERLTLEIANRGKTREKAAQALPKIPSQ